MAIHNLCGFLLDLIPGVGVASDVAKALPKLGRFVVKFADDAPKVIEAIVKVTNKFPIIDDAIPGLIKILPLGTIDNIADSIKGGSKITKAEFGKAADVFKASGRDFTEVVEGTKFKSFNALKNALGNPGKDKQWHHIVEQCQGKSTRSGFDIGDINKASNVKATPKNIHDKISAFYNTKIKNIPDFDKAVPEGFDGTVRDWLTNQSFDEQFEFGLEIWEKAMNGLLFNQL